MFALLMITLFQQPKPAIQRTEVLKLKRVKATEVDAALVKAWPNVSPNVSWTVDTARNALTVTGDDYEIGTIRHFISLMEEPLPGLMKVRYDVRRIHIPGSLKMSIDWSDSRNIIVGPGSDPPTCKYASIYEPEVRRAIEALPAEESCRCDCSVLNAGHVSWSTGRRKSLLNLGTRVNGDKSISMFHDLLVDEEGIGPRVGTNRISRRIRSGGLLVVEAKELDFDIAITATLLEDTKKPK